MSSIKKDLTRNKVKTLLLCALCLGGAGAALASGPARVEFRCKIVPPPEEKGQAPGRWIVQIRTAGGELVRGSLALEGQKVRFRDLEPGIYTVCLEGALNRRHCESVDMYSPADRTSYTLSKELPAPESVLNQDDAHSVTTGELAVPQAARDEFFRAEVAEYQDQEQEAIQHLEAAVKIDPDYPDALNNLGAYYHRNGEFDKSLECFARVTRLNPGFFGGWVNLSGSLMSLSRFREALEASKRAFVLRPREPIVLSNYAKVLYYVHDYAAAQKYFEELDRLDPQYPSYPQLFLAQMSIQSGDLAAAKRHWAKFLKMHPNAPEAQRTSLILRGMSLPQEVYPRAASSRVQGAAQP